MVTITIAETESIIAGLLEKLFLSTEKPFRRKKTASGSCYLLSESDKKNHCEVLLLHTPATLPPPGNEYITILNADQKATLPQGKKSLVITYGLNSLATLTASSMHADREQTRMHCCLQRSIITLSGKIIEPQEFPVMLPESFEDTTAALGFAALGLVLSLSPDVFGSLPFHS